MAHFAEVNEDGIVLRVLVVSNEQEHRGHDYLANELGLGGMWVQTSYNNNGGKYLGIGDKVDEELFADLRVGYRKKLTLQEQAKKDEAKRLADQEAQRIADMGKISNLPKVKGTFVSKGE